MANPFYDGPRKQNTQNNPYSNINNIYKTLITSKNPIEIFNNLAKNNPNLQPIADLLNGGYSPQQVFNMVCEKRGIDPQNFIKSLTDNNTSKF